MDTKTELSKDGTALYGRIARVLRQRIVSNEWPVGMTIPTLEQLIMEFNVSRRTVRQAIQQLIREGLVDSRRGKGTVVLDHKTATPPAQGLIESTEQIDMKLLGSETVTDLPLSIGNRFKLGEKYRRIRKLHIRSGVPIEYMEIHVIKKLAPKLTAAALRQKGTVLLLQDELLRPDVVLHHCQTVGVADREMADLLQCGLGDPIINWERAFCEQGTGQLLWIGHSIYVGSQFKMEFSFSGADAKKAGRDLVPSFYKK